VKLFPQERKTAPCCQELHGSADFFRSLLEGLPDAVVVVNSDNRIALVNAQTEKLFGYTRHEVLDTPIERVIPAYCQHVHVGLYAQYHSQALTRPMGVDLVLIGRRKDGSEFPAKLSVNPVETPTQLFITNVIREITKPPRQEAASRQSIPPCDNVAWESQGAFPDIVGQSQPMRELLHLIKLVAKSQTTVLIQGESGTGKELIARAIHQHSLRSERSFVTIDCGAMPETLLESELFGYAKGAFTGASSHKKGLVEEAHGGTLFLDELHNTTLAFQAKLLRVLQEGEIRPVGSTKSLKVNVRVIAATNKSLKQAVEQHSFREDLYYRLAVVPILVPPLRQRQEDIPFLVDYFVRKYSAQNRQKPKRVSATALQLLLHNAWPGNVRELEHLIERAVLLSPGPDITPEAFSLPQAETELPKPLRHTTRATIETVERERIIQALQHARGNHSAAARCLQISRSALYNKLKRYHLTD
jgi:PAS domain S-box-containing protein